jgi:hypothetical protein
MSFFRRSKYSPQQIADFYRVITILESFDDSKEIITASQSSNLRIIMDDPGKRYKEIKLPKGVEPKQEFYRIKVQEKILIKKAYQENGIEGDAPNFNRKNMIDVFINPDLPIAHLLAKGNDVEQSTLNLCSYFPKRIFVWGNIVCKPIHARRAMFQVFSKFNIMIRNTQ